MEFTLDREIYDGEEFEATQKDHGIHEELATEQSSWQLHWMDNPHTVTI